jgi:hypothetical protein
MKSLRLIVVALLIASGLLVARPADVVRAACGAGEQCATINLTLAGYGSGVVASDPPGFNCNELQGVVSGDCSRQFSWTDGSPYFDVTLIFTPQPNSYACLPGALGEACYGLGEVRYLGVSVYNGQTLSVAAKFKYRSTTFVVVSLAGDGSGRVTSSPAGIDCRRSNDTISGECANYFAFTGSQMEITFNLVPDDRSYPCWEDPGSCAGVGIAVQYKATLQGAEGDLTKVTKWFGFYTGHPILSAGVTGSGTITSAPAGISCPSDCSNYFPQGSTVNLTATPKAGYAFSSWSGACAGAPGGWTLPLARLHRATTAGVQSV